MKSPWAWGAFPGLSVETTYVGPQKAAFSMAEGRKEGKRKGLGREAGRSTVDGHESQTWIWICAAGSVWMSFDLGVSASSAVWWGQQYLCLRIIFFLKWYGRHEKHHKVTKSSLLLWFPESGPIDDLVWHFSPSFIEVLNNSKWDAMWDVMNHFNGSKNNAKAIISIPELAQTCLIATGFMFKTRDPCLPEKLSLSAPPCLLDFL